MLDFMRNFFDEKKDFELNDPWIPFFAGLIVGIILSIPSVLSILTVSKELARPLLEFGLVIAPAIFVAVWFLFSVMLQNKTEAAKRGLKSIIGWVLGFYPLVLAGWLLTKVGLLNTLLIYAFKVGLLVVVFAAYGLLKSRLRKLSKNPTEA